jgi:hypothetical protein
MSISPSLQLCKNPEHVHDYASGSECLNGEPLLYGQWESEFKPLLGSSARWAGFCYLMRDQLERENPVIIETGTLREPGNWKGDGQSTRLWQWVAEHKKACVVSVDRDLRACELARRECGKVHVVCEDSVSFLRGFMPFAVTLLYLDSIEWGPTRESNIDCWMNQIAELAAIWGRLPSGCLIASDDSQERDRGKPVLTRRLFEALGIEPVYDGYIVCWRKP